MKTKIVSILTISIFILGNFTFTSCKEAKTEMKMENVAYACPMHPEITGVKGDQCSKCGMDLTPITGEDHKEYKH